MEHADPKRVWRRGARLFLFAGAAIAACSSEVGEPTLDVDAKKLVEDYEDNEIGADEQYKGKVARIKGKVESISKGVLGDLSITLRATLLFGGDVVCEFNDSQADALSKLKPGQWVTVVGRITGRTLNSAKDVSVEDCRIE